MVSADWWLQRGQVSTDSITITGSFVRRGDLGLVPIASTSNDFLEFRQAAPAAALSFGQGAYDGA
jgi:hypothetical protein